MITVHSIRQLQEALHHQVKLGFRKRKENQVEERKQHASVGLVPTMGYLHEGHASLLSRARSQCDIVVLSIFVNPIQFGPNEDYHHYPRDKERDLRVAKHNDVDIVFMPTTEMMYPTAMKTRICVFDSTDMLCGAARPGHFDGVATVVCKLFHLVQPDKAYFGMKDAQQVAVIQRMVTDLNFPVEIVPCPIVREDDGLAFSSRNVYLSQEERKQALVLSRTLQQVDAWLQHSVWLTVQELQNKIKNKIEEQPLAIIDYVEIVSFPQFATLQANMPITESTTKVLIALAVRFGRTRLIDNRILSWVEKEE